MPSTHPQSYFLPKKFLRRPSNISLIAGKFMTVLRSWMRGRSLILVCLLLTHYDNALILVLVIPTEVRVDKFLQFYRESFPKATVTPKLHMMEDHIVPFLRKWRRGLGLLGEQGAESIHARFNSIRCNYTNMPNPVERLECIMREHFNQLCPENIVRLPEIKKRKMN